LDRIDQTVLPLDGSYYYEYTGAGVTVFLVDSGIRATHDEFRERVKCGFSVFPDGSCEDSWGHGTHVAGIVGGTLYGVAKEVQIVAVKVLSSDGNGATSDLIAGINYIQSQKEENPLSPMVANMSLGGLHHRSLNMAVENAVAAGVVFVASAGNENQDACFHSPASSESVITVASINNEDFKSPSSNYGSCVDIFAPGENIMAASISGDNAFATMSGTSMASPFVAGVVALYLEAHPLWKPHQVKHALEDDAVSGTISQAGWRSPNLLLNTKSLVHERFVTEVTSNCSQLLSGCQSDDDCCAGSCTLGLCFFW